MKIALPKHKSFCRDFSNYLKRCFYIFSAYFITQTCFAEGGTDLLKDPAANLFATFKGTGIALLIVAEIIGAYALFRRTGDMKAWLGLPVLLVITGWAVTKF